MGTPAMRQSRVVADRALASHTLHHLFMRFVTVTVGDAITYERVRIPQNGNRAI